MKSAIFSATGIILTIVIIFSCKEGVRTDPKPVEIEELTKGKPEVHGTEIKGDEIQLANPLNAQWVEKGNSIYSLKCQACHKLTGEKLVGPGWKDVTKRREPVWIMNMITNVDMMLETDPEAQRLLEQCLVRMPNQNVSKEEARQILEFMRSNDGEK